MCDIHQVLVCSATTAASFGGKSEPFACRVYARVCHRSASGLDQMNPCAAHVLTLPDRQSVELHALVARIYSHVHQRLVALPVLGIGGKAGSKLSHVVVSCLG